MTGLIMLNMLGFPFFISLSLIGSSPLEAAVRSTSSFLDNLSV